MKYGDIDAAFAKAAHVFKDRIFQHRESGTAAKRLLSLNDDVLTRLAGDGALTEIDPDAQEV